MRTAVAQPSAVYPLPTRASKAWQLMHFAAAISLPLPSGKLWLQAGCVEHSKAAAIKDGRDFFDMVSPLVKDFPPVKVLRWRTEVQRVRPAGYRRSEEHTSELQSHVNLVCRLLLEKK